MLFVENKDIVLPGSLLTDNKYKLGRGTFKENGKIYSNITGLVYFESNEVSVIPLKYSYTPKYGDLIIGKVIHSSYSSWSIDINSNYEGFLPTSELCNKNEQNTNPHSAVAHRRCRRLRRRLLHGLAAARRLSNTARGSVAAGANAGSPAKRHADSDRHGCRDRASRFGSACDTVGKRYRNGKHDDRNADAYRRAKRTDAHSDGRGPARTGDERTETADSHTRKRNARADADRRAARSGGNDTTEFLAGCCADGDTEPDRAVLGRADPDRNPAADPDGRGVAHTGSHACGR